MLIIVTEDIYNEVLARYGAEYVGMDEDGNFCIDLIKSHVCNTIFFYNSAGSFHSPDRFIF